MMRMKERLLRVNHGTLSVNIRLCKQFELACDFVLLVRYQEREQIVLFLKM